MFTSKKLLSLFVVSVVALMLCAGTTCWASLVVPAMPEFDAEQCQSEGMGAGESNSAPDPLAEEEEPEQELPTNPLRLTARKALATSGSSSSSNSSPSPTSGASNSVLCEIALDPAKLAQGEQSARLYAETVLFIPSAVQSRLFRPPRLS